ncbi:Trp biosynthesis-associated membrane protein [Nocardioides sp.]|uniref:Trp biosynthesis-associated membrane protein n=1 Tax=Nocardioides sp. TaxID=35761 RepID=UPI002734807A|nr:Trp biosynthesis-associated membrane protein [Nocardioides sp.]MDP3892405.1 Trp biosynthesis-associated membrane protein [Nocardioides sp.]
MTESPGTRRRTFGPVVLLGLAAAGLSAVAGNRPWVRGELPAPEGEATTGYTSALALDLTADMPAASALSLVLLAGWGVLLVTRGRVRRAMALLSLLAAAGLLATVVVGARTLPASVRDSVAEVGGPAAVDTGLTVWYAAAAVGALLSLGAAVLALRLLRHWPEMGSRYDAPGRETTGSTDGRVGDDADAGNLELWKAIDEGRDPTA